jgi:DNA mismatch repair protein MutS2
MGDEIDIRGNRAQEALEKLDTYLDQALARGLSQVRIVHGKGTGALRQAVWRHLANSRIVVSYELASAERGGEGATEAQFTS